MNILNVLKKIELGILWQGGVMVTPEQVGLKPGDLPSSFQNYLKTAPQNGNTTFPTPPTPPADPNDPEAQRKFNEELVAYNQQVAAHQQRMFSLMMQQFQMFQRQAMRQASQSPGTSSSAAPAFSSDDLGIGGVL